MRKPTKTPKTIRELTLYEKVLFGNEASSDLIEAYSIINACRPVEAEELMEQIKHSPFIDPERPSFSLVLQAIFAQRGNHYGQKISYLLLKYCKEENYVPNYPVNLIIGLVEGFLKYGPAEGWGSGLGHLSEILRFFMTGKFSIEKFSTPSGVKSRGQLSETISAFLAGSETRPGIKNRIACITNAITATEKDLDSGKQLSPLGETLMEELCRKVFGRMSIKDKMGAITLTVEEEAKQATPVNAAS